MQPRPAGRCQLHGRMERHDWTGALSPAKRAFTPFRCGQARRFEYMKFVHAADLHLDSPLRGLSARSRATLERVRTATRHALSSLVELCIAEQAGLLVIAGDVYDGDWRDYSTGLYFAHQMSRLRDAGVQVIMIRGNHDAASQITKTLRLPDNVRELSAKRAQTLSVESLGVAVHGQSFASRAVTENLAQSYPQRVPGLINVGLLHTSVSGRAGHEPYAPCSLDDLRSKGYDYWALGHVHAHEVLSRDPWIAFSGNLQGRHAREPGAKGALVVEYTEAGIESVELRSVDVARYAGRVLDLSGVTHFDDVLDRLQPLFQEALQQAEGRVLGLRVEVTGTTGLHARLAGSDALLQEAQRIAEDVGGEELWIEKLQVHTAPDEASAWHAEQGVVAEVLESIAARRGDDALLDALRSELVEGFKNKLPSELREGEGGLSLEDASVVRSRFDAALALLSTRLLAADPTREADDETGGE